MRAWTVLVASTGVFVAACSRKGSGGPGGGMLDGASADGGAGHDAVVPHDGGSCTARCGPSFACCTGTQECVRDRCLDHCDFNRCGANDEQCCASGEVCVGTACVAPGRTCTSTADCPTDYACEPLIGACLPIPPGAACRYVPPSGVFSPVEQWSWTGGDSITVPLVVQVTDDNADGRIDAMDVPDVVVTVDDGTSVRLIALSGDDGHVQWESPPNQGVCMFTNAAAADLDGDGLIEIVTMRSAADAYGCDRVVPPHVMVAYDHTGAIKWRSDFALDPTYAAIAVADLDGDGHGEVIAPGAVLHYDGTLWWQDDRLARGPNAGPAPTVADLDGDGMMEVIVPGVAFHADGTVLWTGGTVGTTAFGFGSTAVAHFVDDGSGTTKPQVVTVTGAQMEILDGATGHTVFGPISFASLGDSGPPVVADFDGDGDAEIGMAADSGYVVLDPGIAAPYVLWSRPSEDVTIGSAGSTVFDFDADGRAEVVFADECNLRVLRGSDGHVLWSTNNTSLTAFEYPVVADVDNDGNAELVAVGNAWGDESDWTTRCTRPNRTAPFMHSTRGIRVFRDRLDNWVPTRGVWNEHAYHIDNINEDGSLPRHEAASWATHDSYRQNRLVDPSAITLAPDLVVMSLETNRTECSLAIVLRARVKNAGSLGVPAGLHVAFYEGDPTMRGALLGVGRTDTPILAGASAWAEIRVASPPLDADHLLRFFAVADDDGTGMGEHSECREDNNASSSLEVECKDPI